MKRHLLLAVIFSLTFNLSFADRPPSWLPYRILSANNEYFGWVNYSETDTLKDPWDRDWNLKVYSQDSLLVWKTSYHPSGYPSGILSNDGEKMIYIDNWYYDGIVIRIKRRNKPDLNFAGKSFNIPSNFLEQTVSHQLWLKDTELDGNVLKIVTRANDVWLLNLENGKMELKANFKNYLIAFAGLVFFIVLILIIRRSLNYR